MKVALLWIFSIFFFWEFYGGLARIPYFFLHFLLISSSFSDVCLFFHPGVAICRNIYLWNFNDHIWFLLCELAAINKVNGVFTAVKIIVFGFKPLIIFSLPPLFRKKSPPGCEALSQLFLKGEIKKRRNISLEKKGRFFLGEHIHFRIFGPLTYPTNFSKFPLCVPRFLTGKELILSGVSSYHAFRERWVSMAWLASIYHQQTMKYFCRKDYKSSL